MLRYAPSRNADGIAELGFVLRLSGLSRDDVFGAEPHVHVVDHRHEQLVVDVALPHDVAARQQRPVRRHDARVGLRPSSASRSTARTRPPNHAPLR